MEISNPIIPTAVAGHTNIGKSSRLPVKADQFAVNPDNSKLPGATEENPNKNRQAQVDEENQQGRNTTQIVDADNKPSTGTDKQLNPLVLARQKAGQLATFAEGSTNLATPQDITQSASGSEEAEQLPRSIQTYLDTSKINPDEESVSKNIDFFI